MKRRNAAILGAALVAVGVGAVALANKKYNIIGGGGETVVVTVSDKSSGVPLSTVSVTILASGIPVAGNITDSTGTAVIPSVPDGSYTLKASTFGYQTAQQPITVSRYSKVFQVQMSPGLCPPPPTGGCPCGTYYSTIDCACVPQIPAQVLAQSSYQLTQPWSVLTWTHGSVVCGYALDPSLNTSCPPGAHPPGGSFVCPLPGVTDTVWIELPVQVLDAKGTPVCGVSVNASLNNAISQQWHVQIRDILGSIGVISGYFGYQLRTTTSTTDVNGNAFFVIQITIGQFSTSGNGCFPPPLDPLLPCQNGQMPANVPFELFASLPAFPGVHASVTQVNMQALICGYGYQ